MTGDRMVRCVGLPLLLSSWIASGAAAQEAGPSDDYFQQGVRYVIEATLDEEAQVLRGVARVEYVNRSPEALDRLFFHQHLDAFRPNSIWAREERRERYDFQALGPEEHAFERLLSARLLSGPGAPLTPAYPHAPDSTVLELALPAPLAPGDSLTLALEWEARPSTLCRRQCREDRHWDFAQWYPRIAVYDRGGWQAHPLYPQGEFYGEFAIYDVTLDLADDQVVGATGVPVEGDPGWAVPATSIVETQRAWYGAVPAPDLGFLPAEPAPGRKRIRFHAEDVHHFAWSADPAYIHEGGEVAPREGRERAVRVHVLYRPGDEEQWGDGQAVERTIRALSWLEDIFGPYPWPQLTNLHRLEGGGTEFPMVIMNGGASPGLIVHETAHQYVHGIFANNEWKAAWLDEGFASFLGGWFFQEDNPETWRETLDDGLEDAAETEAALRRDPEAKPIASLSESLADFGTYGYMSYTRPSLVFHMLRGLLGEPTFRRVLHEYYERHALRHVMEADLRNVVEDVSGRELDWFFDQWLHTTATLDYAIGEVTSEGAEDGRWRTRVEVLRNGEAWMPLIVQIGPERVTLTSRDRGQVAEAVTGEKPPEVLLDPDALLLDADPSNDRRTVPER
ncbi:MAG: M1 family aminopeptidase [Gemmatimonadota bacterium]